MRKTTFRNYHVYLYGGQLINGEQVIQHPISAEQETGFFQLSPVLPLFLCF